MTEGITRIMRRESMHRLEGKRRWSGLKLTTQQQRMNKPGPRPAHWLSVIFPFNLRLDLAPICWNSDPSFFHRWAHPFYLLVSFGVFIVYKGITAIYLDQVGLRPRLWWLTAARHTHSFFWDKGTKGSAREGRTGQNKSRNVLKEEGCENSQWMISE